MKIAEIIAQLQSVLPKYADDFSELVAVTTLTQAAGVATAACAAAHGLASNDYAVIRGALAPNTISSLTAAAGVATAVTAASHDLTLEDGALVNITGAVEAKYNGSKALLSVVDQYTFTYAVDADTPATATGSPKLNESRATGYNGRVKVTVTGPTTFTYPVSATLPASAAGTIKALTNMRITGAVSIDWLANLYTQNPPDKLWLFVVPGGVAASHNRQIQNDATYRYAPGQAYFQEILQAVSIVAITPTKNEVAGRAAVDHYEDLRASLFKSLLGVKFTNQLSNSSQYGLTYVDDKVLDYNGAYLAYVYNFEMPSQVDNNDICREDDSVAWRSFDMSFIDSNTAQLLKNVAGKLP